MANLLPETEYVPIHTQQELLGLPKDQFARQFLPLTHSDIFSAVTSHVATTSEILCLGLLLQQSGVMYIDITDAPAVIQCARDISAKLYQEYYRQN